MTTPPKYCLFNYDTQQWPFAQVLSRDVFKVPQLHRLHEFVKAKKQRSGKPPQLTPEDNLIMRSVMQKLPDESAFYRLYHKFVAQALTNLEELPLSNSKHPKKRVHIPDTPSVSSFHTDAAITHRVDQINLWLPFTDVEDTATLWVESDYGLADYQPIPVRYGQALCFDGGYLSHGTQANTTGVTRISLDFRFSIKNAATRLEGLRLLERAISRSQSDSQNNPLVPQTS